MGKASLDEAFYLHTRKGKMIIMSNTINVAS